MLVLVSTPIGNLKDISERSLEALRDCDLILCEDTRHSKKLLDAYEISTPLLSYHKFNENERANQILKRLEEGQTLCLISDAGTPGICDPGQKLVEMCHAKGIPVSATSGPCAFVCALSLCGFEYERFQFGGFLPKKSGELKKTLIKALLYSGVSCFYETPHHILDTLKVLKMLDPDRRICICRELSKHFEEVRIGKPEELLDITLKGEFCLILDQGEKKPLFEGDLKTLVNELVTDFNLSTKEAIKIAAELGHFSKQDLYREFHN